MNRINYQTENERVDWISFNIEKFKNTQPIASYLFEFFNSNSITRKDSRKNLNILEIKRKRNLKFYLYS